MTPIKSKPARLQAISDILSKQTIHTQDELRENLLGRGIAVTQATLSRDLDELGAIKVVLNGTSVYALREGGVIEALPAVDSATRLSRVCGEVVTAVQPAGNLIVVHTRPGAAHYLASAIDRDSWPVVVGSVAGDDTVLVVTKDAQSATEVAEVIAELSQPRARRGNGRVDD